MLVVRLRDGDLQMGNELQVFSEALKGRRTSLRILLMESAGSHARHVTTSILVYRTQRVNEKRHVISF